VGEKSLDFEIPTVRTRLAINESLPENKPSSRIKLPLQSARPRVNAIRTTKADKKSMLSTEAV
jgi:hypothetical protein